MLLQNRKVAEIAFVKITKNPSWGGSDLGYLSGIDTNFLLFR